MNIPEMSELFKSRKPSAIRSAQIQYQKRKDNVEAINVAIGNVSLPMHPALIKRMENLTAKESPFNKGIVKYTATIGRKETNQAILNIISASGFKTDKLYSQITDGGSHAMELVILGTCGPAGSKERPLLLIDAAYTNYIAMAKRTGRATISITRQLKENGKFTLPKVEEIEEIIRTKKPGALLVIPYDNPTGHFLDHETMVSLAKLCVKYNIWMVSDEAYRELFYLDASPVSIWRITDEEVPGIEGRRISIETASKVWNACGLRIGALVTDSEKFHEKAVFEQTANLCAPAIAQYIFGGLAYETKEDLKKWFEKQRNYYKQISKTFTEDFHEMLPGAIISSPDAAIYSVVDVRNIAKKDFDAVKFVEYCTTQGKVDLEGNERFLTLLVAPMSGFYNTKKGEHNPGKTQMRFAYVESPENMKLVPELFASLFSQYEELRET
ncbi:MAG: pyridoxal phosphate-dependent aminotransferase, partial [Promethearchaeota archaeon]